MVILKFKGQIIFFVKDHFGCIHLYKKNAKAPASLEQYKEYIQSLEKELGNSNLVKLFIVNKEENNRKYIWSSNVWRAGLNENISPNHQKYITFLEENRKDLLFIGPYKSMRTKSLHLCSHGHEWRIQPSKVKDGETCSKCKKKIWESHGAKYITELLVAHGIEFIKEVPLSSFGHEQDLRLDFVVCKNNYPVFVIEFHGVQHYRPIRNAFFGGYEGFRKRKIRDKIKRDFCWEIGLPVIDIPYSDTEEQIDGTLHYFLCLFELNNY